MKTKNELFSLVLVFSFFIAPSVFGDVRKIEFVKQPRSQVSVETRDVAFECSAVTTPSKEVSYLWKKDGKYMDMLTIPRASISPQGRLDIKSIRAEDFGVYECVAMCEEGAILSQPAILSKAALSWTADGRPVHVKEGAFYLFRPNITTNVDLKITWKMCSKSQVLCRNLDQRRMTVTAEGYLLISPISSVDDTFYPKITITGRPYFGTMDIEMGTITVTEYLHNNWKKRCPVPVPIFLQTQRDLTAVEGTNLTVDCLAVMKRCENNLVITWRDQFGNTLSNSRKLHLVNITKVNEGFYTCTIDAHGHPSHTYEVKVLEKPIITTEPSEAIVLGADRLVSSGIAQGADSVEWYTNGEKIARNSSLYELSSAYHLKILPLASALSGIYQIVYKNRAGVSMRTVKVDIPNGICGERSDSVKGEIKFFFPKGFPGNRTVHCIWIIQTFSTAALNFYFNKFGFRSSCNKLFLDVQNGLEMRNSTKWYHFCSTSLPSGIFMLRGPYITVYLEGNSTELTGQGFQIIYGSNITIPPTATASSPAKMTTKAITVTGTAKNRTPNQTTATTKGPKIVSTIESRGTATAISKTASALSTNSGGKSTSTSTSKLETTSKTRPSATKSITHATDKSQASSVIPPKKAGQGTSKNSSIALYSSIIAVGFVMIVIIIGAIYYRRRKIRGCHAKEPVKNGGLLASNHGSLNEYKGVKPMTSKETSFTINGHSRPRTAFSRSDFESPRYEACKPNHEKDFTLENYTALQFEEKVGNQPYTSLSFKDEPGRSEISTGPTYAIISPENDAQYMPVCGPNYTGVLPLDNSLSAPIHGQQNGLSSSLWPVYQELEIEDGYQNRSSTDKVDDRAGSRRREEIKDLVDHTYAEAVAEPFYHIVNENASDMPSDEPSNQKEILNRADDYLAPSNSTNLPKHRSLEPAYSPTHYIQPNPADKGSRTMRPRNGQYKSTENASRRPNSADDVRGIQRYKPITSEDETYLTIMK